MQKQPVEILRSSMLRRLLASAARWLPFTSSRNGVAYEALPATTDEDISRHVLRKIDTRLIPLLFVTYMLNFMDKTILSSASVFGLKEDTGLRGQEYSWVSSIFYVGYLLWTYPTTILIARLPIGKYLGANTLFWGAVVALTAACTGFRGLLAARFLLGVAEATITPAFVFVTSTWYTREEMPSRTGIWFSGNSFGGLLASLFAFWIGHVHDSVGPWRWMFIWLGTAIFLWAFVLLRLLPDSISTAEFLTKEERQVANERIVAAGTGQTERTDWRREQVTECLVDPKTWFIFGLEVLTQIPNGGTQNFANIVIKSFGFTSLQSTLVNIPYSILSATIIAGTGHLAGRFHQANCLLIVAAVIPCVIGSALIYSRAQLPSSVQLLGYFLLSSGPSAMPLALSLVQTNYRGVTKKMTMTALLFLGYCAGNIAGPQLFREAEAPLYPTAFRSIVVCYGLVIVLVIGLRCYLKWQNACRDWNEAIVDQGPDHSDTHAHHELTDWQTSGFRYRY